MGSPTSQYSHTRHSVGAMCVQYMANAYSLRFVAHSQLAQTVRPLPLTPTRSHPRDAPPPLSSPRHLLLALPTTCMGDAGHALLSLQAECAIPFEQYVLLYHAADLPLGTLRMARR